MNKYENGFSLLEVAAALLILSTTVIILFQFILDTQVSTTSFQDKVIAREIANNRIALMDTIEPPLLMGSRTGNIRMYGKEWIWEEKTTKQCQETPHILF
jgi:Tfp pilus assembly protein PilV